MAFEMGISQKSYSDIENSKVRINLEILKKISAILDIKPRMFAAFLINAVEMIMSRNTMTCLSF
jgi:transcriptional regulator with XRE-family HTH domain